MGCNGKEWLRLWPGKCTQATVGHAAWTPWKEGKMQVERIKVETGRNDVNHHGV